jgi:hypothetical protein
VYRHLPSRVQDLMTGLVEMVEPLEETRSELIFATEPILSALDSAIPSAPRYSSLVELDEVEVCYCILCSLQSLRVGLGG